MRVLVTSMRASRVAAQLTNRLLGVISPNDPPGPRRVPMHKSLPPSVTDRTISGRAASSCWRSASMTARARPSAAAMPASTAEDSPRSSSRRMTRTAGSPAAWAPAARQVSSGLSSSTTMTSWGRPARAMPSRSRSSAMFSASL